MSTRTTATAPARRTKRVGPQTAIVFAEVVHSERYRPHVQRITLRSDEFPGFIVDVPDQFITFIFPRGDRKEIAINRQFTWDDWGRMPATEQPHARNYTVRSWRPNLNEIDVDMVLHDGSTIGMDWARAAEPGDRLAIWGPRIAFDPPPDCDWLLLFADDTGLPAVAAILESLPDGTSATAIVEVDSAADEQPLPVDPRIEILWLYRNGAEPGTTKDLENAVRAVPIREGVNYAWGGGEHRIMHALGRYLRRERGFKPIDVSTIGYWNRN